MIIHKVYKFCSFSTLMECKREISEYKLSWRKPKKQRKKSPKFMSKRLLFKSAAEFDLFLQRRFDV